MFTILVVDGLETDLETIRDVLVDYTIMTAENQKKALETLGSGQTVDLLLLFINEPDSEGFQLLDTLKTRHKKDDPRTIVISRLEGTEMETRAFALGAADYIRASAHLIALKARVEVQTALIQAIRALKQEARQPSAAFDVIINQVPVGIAVSFNQNPVSAEQNTQFQINPAFEKITGRTREELLHTGWAAITHPDDVAENQRYYEQLRAGDIQGYQMDKRFIRPDGSIVWVHFSVTALHLSEHLQFNHIALFQDITEQRAIEQRLIESERSKSSLLSHLPGMAYRCRYDTSWTMLYISAGCRRLTGYAEESLIDNRDLSYNDLIAPEYRRVIWQEWSRIIRERKAFSLEYEITTKQGKRKWVLEMGQAVYSGSGDPQALEGIIIDISDRKAAENALQYNYQHDSLTGLFNRGVLENHLQNDQAVYGVSRRALIGVNLSSIGLLTRAYGFSYTQHLTQELAEALKQHISDTTMLFRTNELAFIFYMRRSISKAELMNFTQVIKGTMESILSLERVGVGLGVLELDDETGANADEAMRKLLIASEIAAGDSDNGFHVCVYDAAIAQTVTREEEIESALSRVQTDARDGGLYLLYQPILDLKTDRIVAFEALARLNTRKLGLVQPSVFIPIAEKTKHIIPVGEKVFRQAFRFLRKLEESGFGAINVSINVSVIQLLKSGFSTELNAMIQEMGVRPENIGIEITESVFSANYREINRILKELQGSGMRILIDDFGVGYSSFSRESELITNSLKIDRYFIDKLMSPMAEKAITRDIVSIAKRLNHTSIAEGVEHERQLQLLKEYGCDKAQGYFISKPLAEEAAIALLKNQEAASP
ncbi:MAG: EAL domain-containing protein [Eubacteriales bacterium]|nr:EAL domain-containing protein [Eubacteriales bacterium]